MGQHMIAVKRVEIVLDDVKIEEILEALEAAGFDSYTVIRGASGKGGRGERIGSDVTGVFSNSYLLLACDPARLNELIDLVKPALSQFGGMCLVSDAQAVTH
jgi:nitrogen regulatory protein PII